MPWERPKEIAKSQKKKKIIIIIILSSDRLFANIQNIVKWEFSLGHQRISTGLGAMGRCGFDPHQVQLVKDPALLWLESDPWLRNSIFAKGRPKMEKNKQQKKTHKTKTC